MFPYIIQGSNITVVVGSVSHTINRSHVSYEKILDAIKSQDWDTVKNMIEPKKLIINYSQGRVSIKDETFYWDNDELHNSLTVRMIEMIKDGFTIEPMVRFMENLMSNPSKRAVTELYGFLETNNLPITPDGHFLAYKKVRANFFDVHSGTMDNSPGKIVSMERNKVDDDKDRTCSTGLHFCSISYLKSFGGDRTVIVKINPRDVVSIPSDYNNAKGRACQYEVISELNVSPEDAFDKAVHVTANGSTVSPGITTKVGTSAFYDGYHDGYNAEFYGNVYTTEKDQVAYDDGFNKGLSDFEDNVSPIRYKFVGTKPVAVVTTVAQEYDSRGRPLSMNPSAIAKRRARAAAKSTAPNKSTPLVPNAAWPFPINPV